jgi:hypothetical protein
MGAKPLSPILMGCWNENSYAALRFSNAKKTNLGLNFMREIKRDVKIHLESRQY